MDTSNQEFANIAVEPQHTRVEVETLLPFKGGPDEHQNNLLYFVTSNQGPSLSYYDKQETIGFGRFGTVNRYKLKETLRNGTGESGMPIAIAIKSILKKNVEESKILLEFSIAQKVSNHKNILPVFGIENMGQRVLIKMELGNTDLFHLKKWMQLDTFHSYEFNYLAEQILNGLSHLHDLSIAHRDLKPQNILAQWPGPSTTLPPLLYSITLKLCDFGVSKTVSDQSETATAVGTRNYMAPEVAIALENNESFHGEYKKADVFSVGVVLYEMWYEKHPYKQFCKEADLHTVEEVTINVHEHFTQSLDKLSVMLKLKAKDRCDISEAKELFNRLKLPRRVCQEDVRHNQNLNMQSLLSYYHMTLLPQRLPEHPNILSLIPDLFQATKVDMDKNALINSLRMEDDTEHLENVKWLIDSGFDVNKTQNRGNTSLHYACGNGNLSVAQLFIKREADVNKSGNNGWAPLHDACAAGHISISKLLIESGAEINFANIDGWTPLHLACHNGHSSVVQILIEGGADVNTFSNNGRTQLHLACENGHFFVVMLLIESGADINKADNDGCLPLLLSCENGHLSVVRLLIENGADTNQSDNEACTSLHLACENGWASVVQLLTESGAEVNRADNNGWTPLHWACSNEQFTVADLLLKNGVDRNMKTRSKKTPLELSNLMQEEFQQLFSKQ